MNGSLSNEQKFIRNLTEKILANLNNNEFGVKEFARELGTSRSSLNRKLQKILNITVNQFIREVRLQEALKMLHSEGLTAAEVAFKVGFSSPAYFNKCFHEYFGFSPGKAKSENMELSINDTVTHFTSKLNQNRIKNQTPFYHKVSFYVFSGFILVFSFFVLQKLFKIKSVNNLISSDERISVAVMPFQNNTNDSLLDVWQDGIQEILINSLSNSEDLKVQQTKLITSYLQTKGLTNYTYITPSVASTISKKLDASVLIFGGIKKEGSILRLNVQLTDSKTGEVIKSFQIDGNPDMLINTSDTLSKMIMNYLLISILRKKLESPVLQKSWPISTSSPDAYMYQLWGSKAYANQNYRDAANWFLKSLKADSAFFISEYLLSAAYYVISMMDSSKYWCRKVYNRRAQLRPIDQLRVNFMYASCFETDFEAIEYLKKIIELDENDVIDMYLLGVNYYQTLQYEKAISILERAQEIYDEWDSKPYWFTHYTLLGKAYHETGQYRKEKRLYKKAEQDFPDNLRIINRQAILALSVEDTISANQYIEKLITGWKGNSETDASISRNLARIYLEAGIVDKSEAYYRKALSLEPENHWFMNILGWLLIDKDLNINEGLELIDKALELSPDHYEYLDTKGWALNKLGRYQEALEILEKSWDLRMKNAVYSHDAFLNLEAAKKAVAVMR